MIKTAATAALCTALAAVLSFPQRAPAAVVMQMGKATDACTQPGTIDEVAARLENLGWVAFDGGVPDDLATNGSGDVSLFTPQLPDDLVELLIWPQAAVYATGDTGGEDLRSIIDLQRKTVAGYARKKDIPQSQTRILRRQIGVQTEAVLVFRLQPDPAQATLICRFALSSASIRDDVAGGFGEPFTETLDNGATVVTTGLNPGRLAADIGAPVTVSGIIETHFSFGTGGVAQK